MNTITLLSYLIALFNMHQLEFSTMKKPLQHVVQPQSSGSDSDGFDQVPNQTIVIPKKLITIADCFEKKEHSWFVSSQIPTDLAIQVQEITFNVHKYPLVSKCGYIGRFELRPPVSNFGCDIKLENFPGGSETFETILRFCYGVPVDLNSSNVASLRCAAEFLEMTEELEEGNLISKTESFLTFVILSSWRDTIAVLKSCETLSPWAENLQIVRRCCDTIVWKACRENSTREKDYEGWWIDDVNILRIDHFTRIITMLKVKGRKPETIGKYIMHYAKRWLPGMDVELEGLKGYECEKNDLQFSILSGRKEEGSLSYHREQKTIIESLVSILPPKEEAVPCNFLLKMLRIAMLFSASPALISDLEKRVGITLEDASVDDLLIPSFPNDDQGKLASSPEHSTMHNIEVVQRIVEYFLIHKQQLPGQSGVSKLLDSYLAEIAKDPNLSITQFQVLAEALPEKSRNCDDGLYRAIDTYLKNHSSTSEHDRKRLCRIMNCEKLSLDACMHAAQNDRLPLRTIIQVLFSEQLKMRTAMRRREPTESDNIYEQDSGQTSTKIEITALKMELEKIKEEMTELQKDYSELQHEYGNINKQKRVSSWSIRWKRFRGSALFTRKATEEARFRSRRGQSMS